MLSEENKSQFQENLLNWFVKFQRDFPWRRTSNPFYVLLAEKLLQQTVARQTVVDAYSILVADYPDPFSLSQAEIRDIEDVIRPLGFLYRAKELRSLAQELVDRHNGQVPANLADLLALTGVGDYAARAVLSFAFRQDVPIVDTNVARLLYRVFGINEPLPANPARKKFLINLAQEMLPPGKTREYNLAVLDLCALVCKPQNPQCNQCPVRKFCIYGLSKGNVT
jgi:A/G-specific adenine glycosylase